MKYFWGSGRYTTGKNVLRLLVQGSLDSDSDLMSLSKNNVLRLVLGSLDSDSDLM